MRLHVIQRFSEPEGVGAKRVVEVTRIDAFRYPAHSAAPGIFSTPVRFWLIQKALFTVPPSTRSAAPVVAEDSGLAT